MAALNDGVPISGPTSGEISDVSELSGEALTYEQKLGLLNALEVAMYNMIRGNGTFGAADLEELGNVGFKITNSTTLKEMREWHKELRDSLKDAALDPDIQEFRSVWDNPGV